MPKQTFFNLPEEKRAHILDCAVEEFAQRGYKGGSISRMVKAAGIAKGSFYQYFADKEDLYGHIMDQIVRRKLVVYERNRSKLESLSLIDFLRLVFQQTLRDFMEYPELMQIGVDFAQNIAQPAQRRIMNRYQDLNESFLVPYIQFEKNQGEIHERVNERLLNYMLLGLNQYLTSLMLSGQIEALSMDQVDRLVDDLEFILQNGIFTNPEQAV